MIERSELKNLPDTRIVAIFISTISTWMRNL